MRISFIVGIILLSSVTLWGQFKKQFHVEDSPEIESTNIVLSVNSGNCFVQPTRQPGVLNVYSNKGSDSFNHSFNKDISGGVCNITLELTSGSNESFGQSISSNLFGSNYSDNAALWKVFLNEGKPYDIKMRYGVGNADIDLSGLSVTNFNIHSGSADVIVGYNHDNHNMVEMDTFFVKVDMGTVKVKNLINAKSKYILADVGFGNLMLDLSGHSPQKSHITGNVGAGTLMVLLPNGDTPMLVKISDSFFCKVRLPHGFSKIEENTYVNKAYNKDAKNLITFNMDVSMGNLIFKSER